jgi:hypothetical protein
MHARAPDDRAERGEEGGQRGIGSRRVRGETAGQAADPYRAALAGRGLRPPALTVSYRTTKPCLG